MQRGRPIGSSIRQNMVEILYYMKKGHGYQIYKMYKELFPKVTLRVMYYHLKKGLSTGEFVVERKEKEKGDYSWGGEAEKIYYALGKKALPSMDKKVAEFFEKREERKK
jgi:hypothetical protein